MAFTEQQYVDMSTKLQQVKEEIHRFIVGQEEAIDYTLYAVLADGHALLEGLRFRKNDVNSDDFRGTGSVVFTYSIYTRSYASRYNRNEHD